MSINFRTVKLVAAKELLEAVRDRRTLFVALILPVLLYPIMMIVVGPLVGQQRLRLQQEVQSVAVTGLGSAAVLKHVLIESPVPETGPGVDPDPEPAPALGLAVVDIDDPAEALREGNIALWVEAGEAAIDALEGESSAGFVVHQDSSDDASRAAYRKWNDAVDRARLRIVHARLERRSLPVSFVDPIRVDQVTDVASAEQRAGYVFGKLLALVLVLMTLSSSFYPAVDVVAGEKERGTMETLLVAPCGRTELVLGKYLAVFAVTLTAAFLNLFSMWLTMGPLVDTLGVDGIAGLEVDLTVLGGILALLIPLAALFSALSIGLSTMARSMKEAQHYLTPLFLLVMPLAMVVVIPNVELTPTLAAVPVANVVLFFRDLMIGKLDATAAAITLVTTVLVAALALWTTVRLFLREETLFRGPEESGSLLQRPAPRRRPSAGAAILVFAASLALIWYLQPLLPADDLLANVLTTQVLVILAPCLLLAWWLRVSPDETFRTNAPPAGVMLLAVPIGLAAPVVNGFLQRTIGGEIAAEGPFHRLAEALEQVLLEQHWGVLILLFAVLPAVCEELLFRGFIMSGFATGRSSGNDRRAPARAGAGAAVGAAVLFALFHIYPEKWAATFFVGLLLGLLTVAGRSIWPAILAHALNNGSLMLLPKAPEDSPILVLYDPALPQHRLAVIAAAVILAVSVLAVVRLARGSDDDEFPAQAAELDAP